MTVLIQSFLDFLSFVLFFYSEWNFDSVDINTPVWKTKAKSELRTEFKIIGGEKILFIFDGKFTIMVSEEPNFLRRSYSELPISNC